jgi:multidrug efflux system membrane fusion protein
MRRSYLVPLLIVALVGIGAFVVLKPSGGPPAGFPAGGFPGGGARPGGGAMPPGGRPGGGPPGGQRPPGGFGGGFGGAPIAPIDNATTTIPVVTATATSQDVPVFVEAIGTVQAYNTVSITPLVSGQMIQVLFKEGQDVKAGDVLAKIDPRSYQAILDQDRAKKAEDESLLANARLDLARYTKLLAKDYTSAQTADTQRALVAQDQAQVAQDQAQIDAAALNLSYTNITAPIDGRTGVRQVDVGNQVSSAETTPLTVITQIHPISVVFTLPQQLLASVSAAMAQGAPEVLALPQTNTTDATGLGLAATSTVLDVGSLSVIDNEVESTTGTIKVKATFPNANSQLWPGGFVTVRLKLRTDKNALVIPPAAIQRGPDGSYVYVVQSNYQVIRRPVTTGYNTETVAEITSGLNPGDVVVTDGVSRLTDNAKVQILPAATVAATENSQS